MTKIYVSVSGKGENVFVSFSKGTVNAVCPDRDNWDQAWSIELQSNAPITNMAEAIEAFVRTLDAAPVTAKPEHFPVLDREIIKLNRELSVRVIKCLYLAGVHYVGQLVQHTDTRLIAACPGINIRSIRAISKFLARHQLRLGMKTPGWTCPAV